ncbi:hypothetical protein QM565_24840 [Geitlerinema splendidum]|nr:hypothetical protein [Geitlerinema splendidum]
MLWSVPDAISYATAQSGELGLEPEKPAINLSIEDFSVAEKRIRERQILSMDAHHHLMEFERERVKGKHAITTSQAQELKNGQRAYVVGNPIRLRFPPTPSGKRVVFFDLEDETGLLNVTCFDATYQLDGNTIVCSPYVTVLGRAQWRDGHMAFLADRVFPYKPTITRLVDQHVLELPVTSGDFLVG